MPWCLVLLLLLLLLRRKQIRCPAIDYETSPSHKLGARLTAFRIVLRRHVRKNLDGFDVETRLRRMDGPHVVIAALHRDAIEVNDTLPRV